MKGNRTMAGSVATPLRQCAENLRRDPADSTLWRRVGMPGKLWAGDALPLAGFIPGADGRRIVLLCGADNSLYYRIDRRTTAAGAQTPEDAQLCGYLRGELRPLGKLPACPIAAITDTFGLVRLKLQHQPDHYITYDASLELTLAGEMPELPTVTLKASRFTTLYGGVAAVALSGESGGDTGTQLSEADSLTASRAVTDAYKAVCRRARNLGYCCQPVLARYRALDGAGNTIATGPTVVLSDPAGFSGGSEILLQSTDGMKTLGGGTVALECFVPEVETPRALPAPWCDLVERLVVEVSDEMEPVTPGEPLPHGIRRDTASGRVTVTARLPGMANGTVTDLTRLRRVALEALGGEMHTWAEYSRPFAADGMTKMDATDAASGVSSSEGTAAPITYSAALQADGLMILCNPRETPFGGWSPESLVTSRDAASGASWRLAVSVSTRIAGAEVTATREASGEGHPPATINPLLCYPSAAAGVMTVMFRLGEKCYRHVFPLEPCAAGGMVVNVAPGLVRHHLADGAALCDGWELPESTGMVRSFPGAADICAGSDPANRIARYRLGQGEIYAVRQLPRSGTGWDFSRRKLLFFGEDGIMLMTLNGAGEVHSIAPVDPRPVSAAGCVAGVSAGKDGGRLPVVAGGDLLSVSGQKVTTLLAGRDIPLRGGRKLADFAAVTQAGWCNRPGEMWLATASGELWRHTSGGDLVRANLPGVAATMNTPLRLGRDLSGELLLSSEGATYSLDGERDTAAPEVVLEEEYRLDRALRRLTLCISASEVTGTVTLGLHRGTEIPATLLEVRLSGAVNAPLSFAVKAPRQEYLVLTYRLRGSSDLRIAPAVME